MRTEVFWLLSFCGFAALSLVCGLLAWPQLSAAWPSIEERIDRFRRQPPLAKVALLVFIVGFLAYGSTKTNQVDQTRGTNGIVRLFGLFDCSIEEERATVTPEDIARGWQLWEVRTNCNISYAMPEGAAFATNWWVRGAYEDCSIVRLGDCSIGGGVRQSNNLNNPNNQAMSFPFGANEYDSVWAFTWGKLRLTLADTNTEIVAVGAPMSAVPCRSRLWSAADTNGSWLVTWENFALNRDTNTPVNAQVELRASGDFITRSNEVATVYRRINQEDWDDDGWRNEDDGNPCDWDEYWGGFWQELPEGANTNVYYWIDVRPRWNSDIAFYGDGPSDLEDPYIWAKAGETYRVQLLIGKTYDVESDRPFDIVAKSDARVEVSNVESNSCTVVWPVTLTVAEGRAPTGRPRLGASWNDGGSTFHVLPDPPWLNGRIVWDTYCCELQGDGTNFTFACDNNCTCEGCTASGNYIYAGYALPFWSWPCGCGHVDDQGDPGVAIDFDKSAIIYEDAYTNEPGVVVHSTRSNAVLRCEVSGGTYGGTLSVTLNEAAQQKLRKVWGDELPNNLAIAPGAIRFFVTEFEILEPSDDMNDIIATAEFLEDFRNELHSDNAPMTAVKVELEAKNAPPISADLVNRHQFGVYEVVKYRHYPSCASIVWEFTKGDQILMQTFYANEGDVFICPSRGGICRASVTCLGAEFYTSFSVIEPVVEARNVRVNVSGIDAVRGHAGELVMFMDMYLLPAYVSFAGLWIQEVPDNSQGGSHMGYYDDRQKGGDWSHVENAEHGAGRWNEANLAGYYGTDRAGTHRSYAAEWTFGCKEWPIPMAWAVDIGGSGSEPFIPNPTTQKFTLWPDGTFRIEKHNHWAQRTIWNSYLIDGVSILNGVGP